MRTDKLLMTPVKAFCCGLAFLAMSGLALVKAWTGGQAAVAVLTGSERVVATVERSSRTHGKNAHFYLDYVYPLETGGVQRTRGSVERGTWEAARADQQVIVAVSRQWPRLSSPEPHWQAFYALGWVFFAAAFALLAANLWTIATASSGPVTSWPKPLVVTLFLRIGVGAAGLVAAACLTVLVQGPRVHADTLSALVLAVVAGGLCEAAARCCAVRERARSAPTAAPQPAINTALGRG